MALKLFVSITLLLSIIIYFIPVENSKKDDKKDDIAQFIFENSTMYSLSEVGLDRVIASQQAVRYQNRDEMYFGDITLYNSDPTKEFKKENIKSDFIVKKGDIYTLEDNVKYRRDDFVKIDTSYLIYDDLKKIAKNSHPFNASYYANRYSGNSIYFEMEKNFIKSKNTHFEVDMTKKERKK